MAKFFKVYGSRFALCLAVSLLLVACRRQPKGMFEKMTAAKTGISFTNIPLEAPQFNILYYLYYYNGAGVAAGDINNDGLTDLFFTANSKGGNKLYLNKGNFVFEDITGKAGVAGTADWCTGATMADVNADGLLDIYTCAVGGGQYGLKGANELYINKGNGSFEPMAAAYGLNFSGLSTQAAFFDYDHDGDLDMYLLNHSKKPHANIIHSANRVKYDSVAGDRLYRQDSLQGKIRFTDVAAEAGIYQSNLGYGLGISVADLNNDGWEDIYIGNDFHENDFYYVNNRNGTFTESGAARFGHYSRFSKGNDAADYNNDGHIDVITVDMLPPDEKPLKTYGSDENPNDYYVKLGMNGYQNQYSRNCLQRNNGQGVSFTETALMSGVSATDWSWCPLFADFDNDGNKDIFISSGIVKRPVDMDYVQFVSAQQINKGLEMTDRYDAETIEKMPDGACHPFFFKGSGGNVFLPVSDLWGTAHMKGYYNGAAWADLDNDGDLDLAINSLNAEAVILRNNAPAARALRIKATGIAGNTRGVGLKAWVFSGPKVQLQQLMPTRGFQSASEPVLHFGLGNEKADSVLILWPRGGYQLLYPQSNDSLMHVFEQNAREGFSYDAYFARPAPVFEDITLQAGIAWRHQENDFSDFNRQYLLPHKQSTRGPRMAVADVNADGLDDFYVCGAMNQPGVLMLQTPGGTFEQGNGKAFDVNRLCEEVDAVFIEADSDGDQDLYVASGGYQFDNGQPLLADHLYINDGKGIFTEKPGMIPSLLVNKSCLAAADVDADGDTDLFVGALADAARYGFFQPSYLLLNEGSGRFSTTGLLPQSDAGKGMITDAVFEDINTDGLPDLIVGGEWMPLTIFVNKKSGAWESIPIPGSSGWWQRVTIADVDGDGKKDIVAGNWGINNKMIAGKTGPLKLYVKDFDKNGREEQVMAYTLNGKEYTFLAKDELERALPVLKKAYLTYGEVAGETVQYMFYDLFKEYTEWSAEQFHSAVFFNRGNLRFDMQALPEDWQVAPVFAWAFSPQKRQLFAGGNFSGTIPYEGTYDGLLLSALDAGKGSLPDRVHVILKELNGEIRDLKWIQVKGQEALLVARNNQPLVLLKTASTQ